MIAKILSGVEHLLRCASLAYTCSKKFLELFSCRLLYVAIEYTVSILKLKAVYITLFPKRNATSEKSVGR